jgi:hypothetical protein
MPPKARISKSNGVWVVGVGGNYPMVQDCTSFEDAKRFVAQVRDTWFLSFAETYSALRSPVVH